MPPPGSPRSRVRSARSPSPEAVNRNAASRHPSVGALVLAGAFLVLVLLLAAGAPGGVAQAASPADRLSTVEKKISSAEARRDRKRGTERVLTRDVAAWSSKIAALQSRISVLQRRQGTVQTDLDREQGRLTTIQTGLRTERRRLVRLRARLAEARRVLSERLVELYQTDRPDMMTVVLNSDGFADLVQRGEFLDRIGKQDQAVVVGVRSARIDAKRTATRLAKLESRQAAITERIQSRRDEIAGVKRELVGARAGYRETRSDKTRALVEVRGERRGVQEDLSALRKEQTKIQEKLGTSAGAGPIKQGSGQWVWPVVGTITSPYCEARSWESCHPGLDIGMPMSAPIRAVDSGTVAIAGPQGGYGNFTCVKHSARLTSCYAHQSSIGVSVGQRVTKGQVIGKVGSTGFSTGPHVHLEARVNGSPVSPMGYL